VVAEEEIFGQRVRRRGLAAARAKALLSTLAELKEGDFVVHADHGIGRYRGLQHLQMGRIEGDFLHLEYAGEDRLYVPVDRIEKVQKYVGSEGHIPRLDKMGGGAWEKAKVKARAAVEELARDLLKIYALREMAEGFRYAPPRPALPRVRGRLPLRGDSRPVGCHRRRPRRHGVGAADGPADLRRRRLRQDRGRHPRRLQGGSRRTPGGGAGADHVLARQHGETFAERFKGTPVEVEMVSRFRSAAEQKRILERTATGKIDVLIGTHRLLQRDVRFKNLGLVIIDEEQRFGVAHKERLKKLRAEVDVLTLTATPIPRTLHMSLMGLRDLSVIDTPPVDRLAIRTYVTRFDEELIREAIRGSCVVAARSFSSTIGCNRLPPWPNLCRRWSPRRRWSSVTARWGRKPSRR
jgi:transcription-repair coupling factor (superfamily II helicase)